VLAVLFLLLHDPAGMGAARLDVAVLLLLLTCSLVRPEGVVLAAFTILVLSARVIRHRHRGYLRFLVQATLVYALPAALYFIWRLSFYGQLLPNTFYAKRHGGLINGESAAALGVFLAMTFLLPALAWLLVALGRGGERATPARRGNDGWKKGATLVCALWMLLVGFQYLRSDLLMNYSHRFFVPFFPLLLVGLAAGVDRAVQRLDSVSPGLLRRARLAAFAASLLLVAQLAINTVVLAGEMRWTRSYQQLVEAEAIPAARFLQEHLPPAEWLVMYDVGAVPYLSGARTLDVGGLNDSYLAHNDLSGEALADYLYSYNPGAFVSFSPDWSRDEAYPLTPAVRNDPRFSRYVLSEQIRGEGYRDEHFAWVFLRRDLWETTSGALFEGESK
jgi:hypothetical protein